MAHAIGGGGAGIGPVIGIIAGVIVGCALVVLVAFIIMRRRRLGGSDAGATTSAKPVQRRYRAPGVGQQAVAPTSKSALAVAPALASPMAQTPVVPQSVGKPVSPVTAVKGGKRVTVVAPGDSGPLVIDTDVVLPHGDAGTGGGQGAVDGKGRKGGKGKKGAAQPTTAKPPGLDTRKPLGDADSGWLAGPLAAASPLGSHVGRAVAGGQSPAAATRVGARPMGVRRGSTTGGPPDASQHHGRDHSRVFNGSADGDTADGGVVYHKTYTPPPMLGKLLNIAKGKGGTQVEVPSPSVGASASPDTRHRKEHSRVFNGPAEGDTADGGVVYKRTYMPPGVGKHTRRRSTTDSDSGSDSGSAQGPDPDASVPVVTGPMRRVDTGSSEGSSDSSDERGMRKQGQGHAGAPFPNAILSPSSRHTATLDGGVLVVGSPEANMVRLSTPGREPTGSPNALRPRRGMPTTVAGKVLSPAVLTHSGSPVRPAAGGRVGALTSSAVHKSSPLAGGSSAVSAVVRGPHAVQAPPVKGVATHKPIPGASTSGTSAKDAAQPPAPPTVGSEAGGGKAHVRRRSLLGMDGDALGADIVGDCSPQHY